MKAGTRAEQIHEQIQDTGDSAQVAGAPGKARKALGGPPAHKMITGGITKHPEAGQVRHRKNTEAVR